MITLEVVVTLLLCLLGLCADVRSTVNPFLASESMEVAVTEGRLCLRLLLSCAICKYTHKNASMLPKLALATTLCNCPSGSVMTSLQGLWSEGMVVACRGCAGASCIICQCAC